MAVKAVLASILILLAFVVAPAIADIPDYCKPENIANILAEGGNITWLNVCLKMQTINWQGYAGQVYFGTAPQTPTGVNATGGLVNGTNINFTIPCDNPTYVSGFITFSNSSSPPIGLVAGNLSILDTLSGNGPDSGSRTFTTLSTFDMPSGTVTNVPTMFSYVNETPQSTAFREGYFNQGANIVFVTAIEQSLLGYNRSYFDFQAVLFAPKKSTIPYYIFADLNFSCPSPPGGGGGSGGAGSCIVFWQCDIWSPCLDGYQYRNCWPRIACTSTKARCAPSRTPAPAWLTTPAAT